MKLTSIRLLTLRVWSHWKWPTLKWTSILIWKPRVCIHWKKDIFHINSSCWRYSMPCGWPYTLAVVAVLHNGDRCRLSNCSRHQCASPGRICLLEVGHTASGGALLSWIIIIIYLPFLDALACLDLNNDNLRKAKGQDKLNLGVIRKEEEMK